MRLRGSLICVAHGADECLEWTARGTTKKKSSAGQDCAWVAFTCILGEIFAEMHVPEGSTRRRVQDLSYTSAWLRSAHDELDAILRRHQAPPPHRCPHCAYRTRKRSNLLEHLAQRHCIGVTWHPCPHCGHRTKKASHLREHLALKHRIGTRRWHHCHLCTYRTNKNRHALREHLAQRHGVGVTWHQCPHCDHRTKKGSHLREHLALKHDVGRHRCVYCLQNRNSRIVHEGHPICRGCFRRATGKESRIEHVWSDFVDRELGTAFLVGADDSLRSLGGCSLKRPDKMYGSPDRVEIDECDEHQHRRANGDYTCEEQRLSELYDEPSICGKQLVVIRWNPDAYTPLPGRPRLRRPHRLRLFVQLKAHLRTLDNAALGAPIVVFYMFYDRDSPRVCRNLPHYFVDSEEDLASICGAPTAAEA